MGKQSQLDKAIAQLEGEIAVLQAAVTRLRQQQRQQRSEASVRLPRAVVTKESA